MRYILILLAGMLIGAMLASVASNALLRRNAYPRSVMHILQNHLGGLRAASRQGSCNSSLLAAHWQGLANLAAEIDPAFVHSQTAPAFRVSSGQFMDLTASIAAVQPQDCAGLDRELRRVNEACEDCHRQYR